MDGINQRSRLLLDIEHDLSLIKNRLNQIEDQFEEDGIIARMAETLHKLAVELEQFKSQQADDAE